MMDQRNSEPLTEFISCPVCCKVFNDSQQRPISLSCGHTVCRSCLRGRLGNERCPFDQKPFPVETEKLPANYALMQVIEATNVKDRPDDTLPGSESPRCYEIARQCIQEISVFLKPLAENSSDDDEGGSSTTSSHQVTDKAQTKCFLSRPLQRKVIGLIQCQLVDEEGRSRAVRIARSIGERIVSELLSSQQFPHQLSANLWAAVRARGCQFLGPAMQEEALKLILLTLETGCMLSRKVLVLYVVGKLSSSYPHASKTAIGHVVQLLYRASCFKVAKRDEESSLMQLKEEFREYDALRREHDAQIVQIAMEAGLRIPPEQWSSLLYGDLAHKSHMQSIMDKLQNPQSFSQCVLELIQVLQRNGDPGGFLKLRHRFEFLSCIDPNPEAPVPSMQDMKAIMQSLSMVMTAFVTFMSHPSPCVHPESRSIPNTRYKTSMCRDIAAKGVCPRGNTCTFAHSQEELDKHRLRSRRSVNKLGLKSDEERLSCEFEDQLAGLELNSDLSSMDDACFPTSFSKGLEVGMTSMPTSHLNQNESNNKMGVVDKWAYGLSSLPSGFEVPASGSSGANMPPQMPPPQTVSTFLTFSQPTKDASSIPFLPPIGGLQTSFHPHNMRGPPPPHPTFPGFPPVAHQSSDNFYPPRTLPGHCPPPYRYPSATAVQGNFVGPQSQPPPFHQAPEASDMSLNNVSYVSHSQMAPSMNPRGVTDNVVDTSKGIVEMEFNRKMVADSQCCERSASLATTLLDHGRCQPSLRDATHSLGGPDRALQSLTNGVLHSLLPPAQGDSLEDLWSRKKEIIHHMQEEPTFLNSRPLVYSSDSIEGGFDGLNTVLGKNKRKREAMPKLVSDMFVATRSTKSLDKLGEPSDYVTSEQWEQGPPPPFTQDKSLHYAHNHQNTTRHVYTTSSTTMATPTRDIVSSSGSNCQLYNSLGSSFEIVSSLSGRASSIYQDYEFSCFPKDDDDETMIPFEDTVVSRFGPISRMARAKTHNCAPVQVTADSSKKMTPVLAVTPLERPLPISVPAVSRFGGTFGDQCLEPCVKPTPTEAPSVWQESPLPSQMNIALLRAGAAEAVSNNERLAYELQAVELEISLKTGKSPEPVRKMIQEAVSCPLTVPNSTIAGLPSLGGRNSGMVFSSSYGNVRPSMGHGHVTDCLANIEHGTNHVSEETAARDIMEEYQRSWGGLKKS